MESLLAGASLKSGLHLSPGRATNTFNSAFCEHCSCDVLLLLLYCYVLLLRTTAAYYCCYGTTDSRL
jgi:hypothetical protein